MHPIGFFLSLSLSIFQEPDNLYLQEPVQLNLVFLHYPPVYADFVCEEIIEILKRYRINNVYYGHIHGGGVYNTVDCYDGIKMRLTSCDGIDFTPLFISQCREFENL